MEHQRSPATGERVGGWLARTSAQILAQAPVSFNQIPHARNSVVANLSSVCNARTYTHAHTRTHSLSPLDCFIIVVINARRVIRSPRSLRSSSAREISREFSHILFRILILGRGGGRGEGSWRFSWRNWIIERIFGVR